MCMFYNYVEYKRVVGSYEEYWVSWEGVVLRVQNGKPEIIEQHYSGSGKLFVNMKATFGGWTVGFIHKLVARAWIP